MWRPASQNTTNPDQYPNKHQLWSFGLVVSFALISFDRVAVPSKHAGRDAASPRGTWPRPRHDAAPPAASARISTHPARRRRRAEAAHAVRHQLHGDAARRGRMQRPRTSRRRSAVARSATARRRRRSARRYRQSRGADRRGGRAARARRADDGTGAGAGRLTRRLADEDSDAPSDGEANAACRAAAAAAAGRGPRTTSGVAMDRAQIREQARALMERVAEDEEAAAAAAEAAEAMPSCTRRGCAGADLAMRRQAARAAEATRARLRLVVTGFDSRSGDEARGAAQPRRSPGQLRAQRRRRRAAADGGRGRRR